MVCAHLGKVKNQWRENKFAIGALREDLVIAQQNSYSNCVHDMSGAQACADFAKKRFST